MDDTVKTAIEKIAAVKAAMVNETKTNDIAINTTHVNAAANVAPSKVMRLSCTGKNENEVLTKTLLQSPQTSPKQPLAEELFKNVVNEMQNVFASIHHERLAADRL